MPPAAGADYSAKKDEELVPLILLDPELYRHLMARHEERLVRYVSRISGLGRDDAEDVAQEALIKAYRNLADFDTSLKFTSWLYRIAHNETMSHFRRLKARPQVVRSDQEDDVDLAAWVAVDPDYPGHLDRHLAAQEIRDALGRLDEKYREVLVLRYLEERDYQEISDILRKPMGTVATLLNRAKASLRQVLAAGESNKKRDQQTI
ncbi:hypothetical protein A3C96_04210 [Candidatus Uhrbacteria bacterium RIFCSPHIGHO2_02_FULL_60_10]|uniref:RNA polymerase sigma factor n=1 Tax=Candidatus Uhrbacteria bacterium RIFCSPHIGHO2_02_FULL_60_10 TaxID=1802392 RepID=A0A1F7U762_9BACT|nr:MAG: hypothetical protein A3C96_04210 [Candidatus Uhrbacteria bacterium RIFCSPHIGHO2_02_FULL_60_10]